MTGEPFQTGDEPLLGETQQTGEESFQAVGQQTGEDSFQAGDESFQAGDDLGGETQQRGKHTGNESLCNEGTDLGREPQQTTGDEPFHQPLHTGDGSLNFQTGGVPLYKATRRVMSSQEKIKHHTNSKHFEGYKASRGHAHKKRSSSPLDDCHQRNKRMKKSSFLLDDHHQAKKHKKRSSSPFDDHHQRKKHKHH